MYRMFDRGPGPLISILLPTRGRVRGLMEAVDSLHSLAYAKGQIEYIFKVDNDDHETFAACQELVRKLPTGRVISTPRGGGYADIHLWLDQMATEARGDWLLNWSDDVVMQTGNWDAVFHQLYSGGPHTVYPDGIYLYLLRNPARPGNHEFFAVRREVYGALGHLSLSPHADTWLATVLKIIERCAYTEIMVRHDNDGMTDAVAQERRQVTARTCMELCSPQMARARLADAAKLLDYIEGKR